MSRILLISHGLVALCSAAAGAAIAILITMSGSQPKPEGMTTVMFPSEGVIHMTQGLASLSMAYRIDGGELVVETQPGRFMRMDMPSDGILRDPILRIGAR